MNGLIIGIFIIAVMIAGWIENFIRIFYVDNILSGEGAGRIIAACMAPVGSIVGIVDFFRWIF